MSDTTDRKSLPHQLRVFFHSMGRTRLRLLVNVLIAFIIFIISFSFFFNGMFFPSIFQYRTNISIKEASHHIEQMMEELYEEDFSQVVFLPKSDQIFHTKKHFDISDIWSYIACSSPLILKSYFEKTLLLGRTNVFKSLASLNKAHSFTYTQYNVLEMSNEQKELRIPLQDHGYINDMETPRHNEADLPLKHTLTFATFMKHFRSKKENFVYYMPWTSFSSFFLPEHIPNAQKFLMLHHAPEVQFMPINIEQPLRQIAHETFFCQAHGSASMVLIDPLESKAIKSAGFANQHLGISSDKLDASLAQIEGYPDRIKEFHAKYFQLQEGDCIYLPSYWWVAYSARSNSVQVRYIYRPHSILVDTALRVIRNGEISPAEFNSS